MNMKRIALTTLILSLGFSVIPSALAKGEDGNLRCYGSTNCNNDENCKKEGYMMVSTEDECVSAGGHLGQN